MNHNFTWIFASIVLTAVFVGYLKFSSPATPQVQGVTNNVAPTISNAQTQVIKASYGPPLGFVPTQFTVKAGIPVRLEVAATENGRGCMGSITIPQLDARVQTFVKGQTNIFEFTPTTPGNFDITCAMGIPHAIITVQ